MTGMTIEQQALALKATFDVGRYDDGSGPVVEVRYDATPGLCADRIWLETSGDNWIAFDYRFADELCAAIQTAAAALAKHGLAITGVE